MELPTDKITPNSEAFLSIVLVEVSCFHGLFFFNDSLDLSSFNTSGVGVGLTRDTSTLMVGQYFKRRRELVEILVVSSSGLGISLMSLFLHEAIGCVNLKSSERV